MKHARALKLLLVAMLIALPLLLSGCYVTPDIPANNNQGGTVDFPEYNPSTATPTVTPTIAPTDSANPSIGGGGVVTLPTSGVNNWTTVQPITTIGHATLAPVTQPPTSATPSPTPQGALKKGSKGEAVREVQKKLKELGFLKGSADGDFGDATEAAVRAFQKQYGLTVDGKVGNATMAKLTTAKATMKPTASPTSRPTATPAYSENTYLRLGDSGQKVTQMQERLITLGYLAGSANGKFGQATEAGVIAFQKRNCSYSDGIAGPDTLKALYSSRAKSTSTAVGVIGVTLKEGSEGKAVRVMQQKLKNLGYYKGSVDGSFGSSTADAVKAFQKGNGLKADGAAGGDTLNLMFSGNAKTSAAASATNTPKPTSGKRATPRPTATPLPENTYVRVTPDPSGDYITLQRGHYGTPVERLQRALKNEGYFSGSVDGYYGEGTANAVKAFQRSQGLKVDGVAGPATQRVLFEGDYPAGS